MSGNCPHQVKIRLLGNDPRLWECEACRRQFSPGEPGHPSTRTEAAR